jgi:biopolymer transport protein ExbD
MGLEKRSKANAEFNMSSLTDIIFLLLIFFMLTSGLVAPNSLNLKLPGSSNARPANTTGKIDRVDISLEGEYFLNGRRVALQILADDLEKRSSPVPKEYNFTIAPAKGTPVEHVVAVMDIALRLNINGILAAQAED